MKVYLVVEWTGTSSSVDGAIFHGSYERGEDAVRAMRQLRVPAGHSLDIVEQRLLRPSPDPVDPNSAAFPNP